MIPITAQCTVFAEFEVITLVGEGKLQNEIAAEIQQEVAKRCFVMAKKAGAKDAITLMGGCVKNQGLKGAIRMKKQSDFCKSVSCRECSDSGFVYHLYDQCRF